MTDIKKIVLNIFDEREKELREQLEGTDTPKMALVNMVISQSLSELNLLRERVKEVIR